MIKQCAVTDTKSRSECNPYDLTGFLPIIVAPMYSCVDRTNAHIFLENKIKVCMPRKEYMDASYEYCSNENYFDSYSLEDFIENFINTTDGFLTNKENNIVKTSVCIDTAAGHLKVLHEAIRKAKETHGENLVIMAGNVSSVEAFIELAKTGCDYIRVGVGSGGSCNTSLQTGLKQEDLDVLVSNCNTALKEYNSKVVTDKNPFSAEKKELQHLFDKFEETRIKRFLKTKIVADGISRFVDQLVERKEGLDNGYAAINRLLYAGADLVMVGKLFAQCVESAGEKALYNEEDMKSYNIETYLQSNNCQLTDLVGNFLLKVKYQGMSTKEAQMRYKQFKPKHGDIIQIKVFSNWSKGKYLGLDVNNEEFHLVQEDTGYILKSKTILPLESPVKPSEGKTSWIPVLYCLSEWVNGKEGDDYIIGFINALKSSMSYTGSRTLKEFKL